MSEEAWIPIDPVQRIAHSLLSAADVAKKTTKEDPFFTQFMLMDADRLDEVIVRVFEKFHRLSPSYNASNEDTRRMFRRFIILGLLAGVLYERAGEELYRRSLREEGEAERTGG